MRNSVESVLLASYGLNIQFVNFNIQCEERVFATINGNDYEWNDALILAHGALGRQRALKAHLKARNHCVLSLKVGTQ